MGLIVDVEVDENRDFVAWFRVFGYIAFGQENLSLVAAVKIHSEVHFLHYREFVVVA